MEGYYFIDWYGDATLSTAYGFNTSVTADTDIYGWYVEKNPIATDFWVTYDFGDGVVTEPVRTQNGTIYALPTAENLMGWWQSDTNNGAELTRKYEAGTVLDSDTTLFAVYDSGNALGASVNDGAVTWEKAIGTTVTVTIYSENKQVFAVSAPSSNMRTSIDELGTGTYTVVVESGSAVETLVYVVNGLARVSGFEILNGTVISFNPVENATGYTIEITNGVRTEVVDLGNSTVYNISGWEMTAEGLTFAVTAHAAGYADSVSNTHNYTAKLDEVVISIADDTVTWNTVENATSYEVEVTVNGVTERFTTYYTSISLKNYNLGDEITVTVKPVASGYYSEATTSNTYKKVSLAAPVIENVLDGVITWSAVEGATGYSISINGEIITLDGADVTSFATSDSNFIGGQGTYTVMVRALGDGTSSAYSDAVIITEKDMGETLAYENGTVSWQYSFAASSYVVQVNNENETIVTYGNTANVTFTKAGDNEITVYFMDENGEKSAAASITIFAYEVVLDAREDGTVSTDVLYVAMGDEIILPDAVSSDRGLTFDAWYTLPDYSPEGYEYSGKGVKMESGTVFTGSSAIFLYAYYTPAEFTITISYTVDDVNVTEEYSVYYKRPFNLPVIEGTGENEGKMFAGWYSDEKTKNQVADYTGYGASYTFTEDTTLYAGWFNYLTYTLVDIEGENEKGYAVAKGPDIAAIPTDEITIPESYKGKPIVELPSNAFRNCTWITTMNIPDTVTYIALVNNGYASGTGAFAGCAGLKDVNVYATEEAVERVYYSDDGVLFEYDEETDETKLIFYPWGRSGSYVVPEKVSNDYEYTYSGNTEIKVERRVDAIDTQVFASNTKLTAITIPATVSVIYSQAFYGCTKLTKVTFLEDDDGIEPSLFMESNVFQGCTALTNVTLPSHMTGFDATVFTGCSELKELTIVKDGGNYTTRDGFLCNAQGTEIVYCAPGRSDITITDTRVTAIGSEVFSGNTKITEVVIPDWIVRIGESAFEGCTGLATLTFMGSEYSNALTIETRAFYGCTALTKVTLPVNLKTLGAYAFGGCSKLTYVAVYTNYYLFGNPDFANGAFGTDASTSTYYITDLYISENTGTMDIAGIFGSGLTSIVIEGIEENGSNGFYAVEDDVIYNQSETELIFFPENKEEFESPDSLLSINNSAFRGKTALKSVVIGAKVETIADYAFANCINLSSVTFAAADGAQEMAQELIIGDYAFYSCVNLLNGTGENGDMSMIFPSNLVSIGNYALYDCRELTEITIPAATSKIGEYRGNTLISIYHVFDECGGLAKINVEEGNGSFWSSEDGVLYNAEKTIIYYTPAAHTDEVALADETEGIAVEQIWSYAFNKCTYLTEIEIPGSVDFIGVNAFYGCTALTKIEFESGGKIVTLEEGTSAGGVFSNLTALTTVDLESRVENIPAYVFYGDSKLTTISIPSAVTEIGAYAFYGCSALTSVTVETDTKLNKIDDHAFYNSGVTSFDFKEGLETIDDYAFYGSKLVEIKIPSTTAYLGDYAFQTCSNLETISFAESTEDNSWPPDINIEITKYASAATVTIGKGCFQSCTSLESVGFPSVSTILGDEVFRSARITNTDGENGESVIELPGTIVEMGSGIFYATTVNRIKFAEDSVIESIPSMFGGSDSGGVKYVNIPASVKTLENSAFYWGLNLEEVTFDEGCQLEYIGNWALAYCSFKEITIPATVTYIGDNAFTKFSNAGDALESVTFEEGSKLEYIGDDAFSAQSLTEIELPESTSALELGTRVFENNKLLTSAYISSCVYTMTEPFKGCVALTDVTVSEDSKYFVTYESSNNIVYKIDGSETKIAFLYGVIDSAGKLDLTDTGLTTIEYGWFNEDTSIKEVILPDTLLVIEDYAFYNCTGITSVTMPSCVTIGNHAFDAGSKFDDAGKEANGSFGSSSFTTITFPANLESIGDYAFYNVRYLKNVTFAEGCALKSIGAYAFTWYQSSNDRHIQIETLSLPEGLEYIGDYAFRNDTSLTSCVIPESVTYLGTGVFYGCTALTMGNIPKNMTSIPNYMFYGCSGLTSLGIEWENILNVGEYAFYGCSKISGLDAEQLSKVESIGTYAFYELSVTGELNLTNATYIGSWAFGSTKLEKVTIGENVSDIGEAAFYYCSDLSEFVVAEGNKAYYAAKDGMLFDSAKRLVCCPAGYTGTEVTFNDDEITEMMARAFVGCVNIEKVELPLTITSIPNYAFRYCEGLKEFEIPATVRSIGNYAFYGCKSLQKIEIPSSVESLGTYVFDTCSTLSEVTFADGCSLTEIPNYAFRYCTSLEKIDIPGCVTYLGEWAFRGCTSLSEVGLHEGLVEMDDYVFDECSSLTSVTFPSTVRTIGYGEFYNCTNLESLTLNEGLTTLGGNYIVGNTKVSFLFIPTTVTEISGSTFYYCNALRTLVFANGIKEIKASAFRGLTASNITVYFLGTEEEYKNITISSSNNTAITGAMVYYYSLTNPTTEGNFWHYVDQDGDGVYNLSDEIVVWTKQDE